MDWLQFLAAIIASLAWPVTVVIIFFLIRKNLFSMLPSLHRFKFMDLEAEFREVVRELKATEEPEAKDVSTAAGGLTRSRRDFLGLAEVSPRSAIMESYLEIERAAAEAYRVLVEDGMKVFMGPKQIASFLKSKGYINEDEFRKYSRLADLRNRAAHEPDMPELSFQLTKEYVDLALTMAARIRQIVKEHKK